ncbi:MAG TPA: hypothetical protein VI386_29765 [Candidatus Sulfotelmatobacter sp.]
MAQGKRERLSAEQRTDMWRRWSRASRCMRLGVPSGMAMVLFGWALKPRRVNFKPVLHRPVETARLFMNYDLSRNQLVRKQLGSVDLSVQKRFFVIGFVVDRCV